jgi:C1A family cysteine protease
MVVYTGRGLGWHRALPDFKDFSPQSPPVKKALRQLPRASAGRSRRPAAVDLREYFPPVYDQLGLNASSVHACVGLAEYFERRANGRNVAPSRLFLYKVARRLRGWRGDVGIDLRTVLKAMKCFGMPPERYWPYDAERFDQDPDGFLYSFIDEHRSMSYVRLDTGEAGGRETLEAVRSFLAAGFPAVFGFSMPGSFSLEGEFQFRPTFDRVYGGQAVVAVGYDDRRLAATRGALLIRNSWGTDWGEGGYGWLPYAFVEKRLAVDFWTLLKPDWLESGEFLRPNLRG